MNLNLRLGRSNLGDIIQWSGIPNHHLCVTGRSGEGKSYLLKSIIPQAIEQEARCIVFDCSGDFCVSTGNNPPAWPVPCAEIVDVRRGGLSVTPFLPQSRDETATDIAERVTDLVRSCIRLGDGQWAYLSNTIAEGIQVGSLSCFRDLVYLLETEKQNRSVAVRTLPKIKKIANLLPFEDYPYDWTINQPGLTILDFHNIHDVASQALMVELIIDDICCQRLYDVPSDYTPLILVFDECQRLRFREGSLVDRILREGRKYGIAGWFGTQWFSNDYTTKVLGQAGLHIYFHPEQDSLHKTAVQLASGDRSKVGLYEKQLGSLKRGQFICSNRNTLLISEAPW